MISNIRCGDAFPIIELSRRSCHDSACDAAIRGKAVPLIPGCYIHGPAIILTCNDERCECVCMCVSVCVCV